MKTTIDMAREVYGAHTEWTGAPLERLEQLVAVVRADEREQGQKWFAATTAQHKQEILAEREACAKFCETHIVWVGQGKRGFSEWGEEEFATGGIHQGMDYATAIRARGNT
jgi:hypothetical protein